MGYEEVRQRALHDDDPDAHISLKFLAQVVEFLRQNVIEEIYRRVIDADECDAGVKPELETLVIRILHG
jgi:hypothetical protein